MDQIHRIRELFYEQGKNLNEIAIIMNCDWRTVRKYVDMEDFSSPPPAPLRNEEHSSKLDPFKPQIDSWMEADKLAPRKQRHTAKSEYYGTAGSSAIIRYYCYIPCTSTLLQATACHTFHTLYVLSFLICY